MLIILSRNFFGALNAKRNMKRITLVIFRNTEEFITKLQGRIFLLFDSEGINGGARLTGNVSNSENSRVDGNGCKKNLILVHISL